METQFSSTAIQKWSDLMAGNQGGVIPTKTSAQNLWDKPLCDLRHEVLLQSTTSEIELGRLKAVSAKHASDWLKAYPVTSLGLKLNNSSFGIACALRTPLYMRQNKGGPIRKTRLKL